PAVGSPGIAAEPGLAGSDAAGGPSGAGAGTPASGARPGSAWSGAGRGGGWVSARGASPSGRGRRGREPVPPPPRGPPARRVCAGRVGGADDAASGAGTAGIAAPPTDGAGAG